MVPICAAAPRGLFFWHNFEPLKLRLADNLDFAVPPASTCVVELHEVKRYWQNDGAVTSGVAPDAYASAPSRHGSDARAVRPAALW